MDRLLGSNGQYIRFPLPVFLKAMQRLGLRRLDFVPQVPHFFCGYRGHADVAPLRAALQGADLQVSVLTPPPYRCSLTAPAGEQRDATIGYYYSCIRLAAELDCHRLVLSAAGACWDIPPQELAEHAAAMLTHLCHTAQVEGVTLLLAPVMGAETPLIAEAPVLNTARQLSQMLAWVDSPALGVCLDTNVMSANGDTVADWLSLPRPHRSGAAVRRQLARLAGVGRRRSAGGPLPLPADRGRLSGRFLPVSPR